MEALAQTAPVSWKEFERNWKNWHWYTRVYRQRMLSRLLPNRGTYVYDEPWDNLIILDACRYDTFKEQNRIEGKLESRISRGSATQEFLLENFSKHPKHTTFRDVVYVTANPWVSWLVRDKFYKIYPVWDYGWDDDLRTVPPGIVVSEALEARKRHQDKRLIIHFMQPHFPPLVGRPEAETGQSGMRRAVLAGVDPFVFMEGVFSDGGTNPELLDTNCEGLLAKGELVKKEVLHLYEENLRIVLSHVSGLTKMLPGTTVVSSDHGDLFGERLGILYPFRTYGHTWGLRLGALIRVPWLTIVNPDNEVTRAEVEKGYFPHDQEIEDDEKIKDRLRKLGYV